jgi:hypothetical protein
MLEMSLHFERGSMVIDDLRALRHSPLVVAEGSTLPARALSSGIAERSRAVWLLPTRVFQQTTLTDRAVAPGPTALHLLLGETIEQEAREHGARTLTVDGSRSIDQMVAAVEELFAAALAQGPRAATLAERQGLLREANQAIASQVRGFYSRPWANGDAEAVVREFVCECGDPGCDASVFIPVRALASGAALAPGHR